MTNTGGDESMHEDSVPVEAATPGEKATQLLDLLVGMRSTLAMLLQTQARFAAVYTLPATTYAVMTYREQIRQAKAELRELGGVVVDMPDEMPAAPLQPGSWQSPLRFPLHPASDNPQQLVLSDEFVPVAPPRAAQNAQVPRPNPAPVAPAETTDASNLHNYLLHEPLAEAVHGTLFRATHQPSGRNVFVHVLHGTTDGVANLLQQAVAQAAQHAHVLPLLAAGYDAKRSAAYVATPPLRLCPLADVLATEPISEVRALYIAIQIGEALDVLHAKGRVHGYVDATQVLLAPTGEAYLADFHVEPVAGEGATSTDKRTRDLVDFAVLLRDTLARGALPATTNGAVLNTVFDPYHLVQLATPTTGTLHARELLTVAEQLLARPVALAARELYATRWEPTAAWLENPLEMVLGRYLSTEFLLNSRVRADALHRVGAITQRLQRPARRSWLGRARSTPASQPEQIVSYNLYFYELSVHYETRTALQTTALALRDGTCPPLRSSYDPWSVAVPYVDPCIDVPRQPITVSYGGTCPFCDGETRTICRACAGRRVITHAQPMGDDGERAAITFDEPCACCGARGWLSCTRCGGLGRVPYEQRFMWSRQGRRYWNEDDLGNLLPYKRELEHRAQEVFRGQIDLANGQWYLTAPLRELCEAALLGGGPDSQPHTVELVIRGVPVTEVDYPDRTTRTVALIGFDHLIRMA